MRGGWYQGVAHSIFHFCIFVFLSFCLSVFLYVCMFAFSFFLFHFVFLYSTVQYSMVQYSTEQYNTVQYSTVQYSNRRGVWCQGVVHSISHSMCGVSVTGAASLVAECGINILFQKILKITFLKHFFGTLPKIRKYVQIHHGFPFLKWCETSQWVQRFEC